MIITKTPQQIEGIKKSCHLAVQTLDFLSAQLKPGISTLTLDQLGHQFICHHGALSAPLGYNGYPKSICTSVNNVVCHGIPSAKQILADGDIINLDITTILDGFYGDVSASFPLGTISPHARKLLQVTKEALDHSLKALKPGKSLNDRVGKIIEPYVNRFGFSVVRELGGHGVGLKFHEDPFVYHFDTGKNDVILKSGMVFTVEPMVSASPDYRIVVDPKDGWTVRTRDGSLSAQFEHTVLITDTGCEILTL